MKIVLLLLALMVPVIAEDWTVCGKSYHDVTVVDSNDSTVLFMYEGGLARLNLSDLPANLQKRFNYDPAKARVAAKAGAQANPLVAQPIQAAQPTKPALTPEQRSAIQ